MTTVLIDLGEAREVPEEYLPAPRRPGRGLTLAVVGLLLLTLLGADARPRYGLVGLFSVPIDVASTEAIADDALYVSNPHQVAAYRLPSGTPLWTVRTAVAPGAIVPVRGAGTVLVQLVSEEPRGVLSLDAGTGRILWQDPGAELLGALPGTGRALLLRHDGVRAVDVPTGRTVWERPRGLGMGWDLPDMDPAQNAPPRLAFDGGDGSTEVVDASSGALLVRRQLESHWPAGVPGPVSVSPSGLLLAARSVVGNQLFVARQQNGHTTLDAYDLGSLAHQWRTTLSPPVFFVTGCAGVLCVDGFSSMFGLDPATGAVRWQSADWRQAWPLPGGRLLVSAAMDGAPASVVDAVSLRQVLGLRTWQPVDGAAGGPWLVARDVSGLRTWFGVLDPARPGVRPLGWAWGLQRSQCLARLGYLACPTVHDLLQVWSYRS